MNDKMKYEITVLHEDGTVYRYERFYDYFYAVKCRKAHIKNGYIVPRIRELKNVSP